MANELGPPTCDHCGEKADALFRQLWFRNWEDAMLTRRPLLERLAVCRACRRRARLQAVVLAVLLVAMAAVPVAVLCFV